MILTDIPGTVFQLDAPAEASWQHMRADGSPSGLTTAYRDSAYQRKLYNGWMARLPGYNFALPPGHSMHELGLAVDVTQVTADWMAAHGAAYGWTRPAGWNAKGITNPEWWHFEYSILRDTKIFAKPSPTTAPIPPKRKVNTVLAIVRFYLKGVGEYIMYASASTVSLSPELSTLSPADRAFNLGIAVTIAKFAGLDIKTADDIPYYDDTPNKGWYMFHQLAAVTAGMPATYPLATTNPYKA